MPYTKGKILALAFYRKSGSGKFHVFPILSVIFGLSFSMQISIVLKIHSYAILQTSINLLAMTCVIFKSIRLREDYKNLIMVENSKAQFRRRTFHERNIIMFEFGPKIIKVRLLIRT